LSVWESFFYFSLNSLDFYLLFVVVVVVAAFLLPSPIDSRETPRVPHSLPVTPSVKEPKMDKKEEEENSHLVESSKQKQLISANKGQKILFFYMVESSGWVVNSSIW
jgi:hypothetical protein